MNKFRYGSKDNAPYLAEVKATWNHAFAPVRHKVRNRLEAYRRCVVLARDGELGKHDPYETMEAAKILASLIIAHNHDGGRRGYAFLRGVDWYIEAQTFVILHWLDHLWQTTFNHPDIDLNSDRFAIPCVTWPEALLWPMRTKSFFRDLNDMQQELALDSDVQLLDLEMASARQRSSPPPHPPTG